MAAPPPRNPSSPGTVLLARRRRGARAHLPCLGRGDGGSVALGQGARDRRHRRGDTASSVAGPMRLRRSTRSTRSIRHCGSSPTPPRCAGAGRRDHRLRGHRSRTTCAQDKDCEWAGARPGMLGLETALSVVVQTMVIPDCSTGAGSQGDERAARLDRRTRDHGRPIEEGEPANLTLVDPEATWTVRADELASMSKNTPSTR